MESNKCQLLYNGKLARCDVNTESEPSFNDSVLFCSNYLLVGIEEGFEF